MSSVKRSGVLLMALMVLYTLAGCYAPRSGAERGGLAGAGVGGLAGALLDSNPWRGGIIGAALGSFFGATLGDVADRGAREAARYDKPVEYYTRDGIVRYYAEPQDYNPKTECTKVHEKVYENGKLVIDRIKEVCKGEKTERRY